MWMIHFIGNKWILTAAKTAPKQAKKKIAANSMVGSLVAEELSISMAVESFIVIFFRLTLWNLIHYETNHRLCFRLGVERCI